MDSYNSASVTGMIAGPIIEDHEIYGETFYAGKIRVERLSGVYDTLPVTIPGRLLSATDPVTLNGPVCVIGNVRSYNKLVDGQNRMYVTVFARSILPAAPGETQNDIQLVGAICKQPVYRITPFGREICDLMIAVNRNYSKSDYIPCIVWGRNALWASHMNVGDHVKVSGRMQSRDYEKLMDNGEYALRTAYELSAYMIENVIPCEKEENDDKRTKRVDLSA